MNEPWLDILDTWRETGHFGLTIPFMYGGLLGHPSNPLGNDGLPKDKFLIMLKLFSRIGAGDQVLRLAYCGTVDDLALAPVSGTPMGCVGIIDSAGASPKLWVQHNLMTEGDHAVDGLAAKLWQEYCDVIISGNFSKRDQKYCVFDQADRHLLKHAYTKSEL